MENDFVSIEEKIHMTKQFMKNLHYNRFNIELSLLAENAVSEPNHSNIGSLTLQLQEIDDKLAALQEELTTLEGQ